MSERTKGMLIVDSNRPHGINNENCLPVADAYDWRSIDEARANARHSEGPVEIWLPPSVTTAELSDLILPHVLERMQLAAKWIAAVESFSRKKAAEPAPSEAKEKTDA